MTAAWKIRGVRAGTGVIVWGVGRVVSAGVKNKTGPGRTFRLDGHYNLPFIVPDGGYTTMAGTMHRLHYIGETHFRIDRQYFHVCQFGEQTFDQSAVARPE